MIPKQIVKIKPVNSNSKTFKNMGYNFDVGETIEVDIKDISKRSTAVIKFRCDNCSKAFTKRRRDAGGSNRHFCSNDCRYDALSNDYLKNIEAKLEGESLLEFLEREYSDNKKSTREISMTIYNDESHATSITNWLNHFGIRVRQGSEAIKLQWAGNEERKRQAGRTLRKIRQRPEVIKRLNKYRKSESFRNAISKANAGKNNGMFGRTGKKSPRWNPDYNSSLNKLYRKDLETVRWRKEVFDRDEYKCKICGDDKGGNLNAHHLDGWDKHIDKRHDEDNGITLCNKCHRDFHNIYGYGKNTKEQFIEYKVNRASNK